MKLWHCRKCHHEWEGGQERECDWCHADKPRILADLPNWAFYAIKWAKERTKTLRGVTRR